MEICWTNFWLIVRLFGKAHARNMDIDEGDTKRISFYFSLKGGLTFHDDQSEG